MVFVCMCTTIESSMAATWIPCRGYSCLTSVSRGNATVRDRLNDSLRWRRPTSFPGSPLFKSQGASWDLKCGDHGNEAVQPHACPTLHLPDISGVQSQSRITKLEYLRRLSVCSGEFASDSHVAFAFQPVEHKTLAEWKAPLLVGFLQFSFVGDLRLPYTFRGVSRPRDVARLL